MIISKISSAIKAAFSPDLSLKWLYIILILQQPPTQIKQQFANNEAYWLNRIEAE